MLQAVILVCALGSANPSTCFLQGQAYLAETSLDVRPGDQVKIICPRAR